MWTANQRYNVNTTHIDYCFVVIVQSTTAAEILREIGAAPRIYALKTMLVDCAPQDGLDLGR